MYKVDGVDLSTTEFQVLEELVAKSRGEEGLPQPNREMFPVYERLVNLGLLHGRAVAGGFAGLAVSPPRVRCCGRLVRDGTAQARQ